MKILLLIITVTGFSMFNSFAQQTTFTEENLKQIDLQWEDAQLKLNYEFIESLLSNEFIWVHNHAGTIDSKAVVLERIQRYISKNNKETKSRNSKDVNVIIEGKTAIVHGYTIIDRGPTPTKYHFMRTYVETQDGIKLIANQTMAIPQKTSK